MTQESQAPVPAEKADDAPLVIAIGEKKFEVVEVESKRTMAIFDPILKQAADLEKRLTGVVFDLSIPKERRAAGSLRAEATAMRTSAKKAYEAWNKPRLAAAATAREVVEAWEGHWEKKAKPLSDQIETWDAAEKDRIAKEKAAKDELDTAIKAKIAGIDALPITNVMAPVATLDALLTSLGAVVVTVDVFGDFVKDAEAARTRAIAALNQIRQGAVIREEQERELEQRRLADEQRRAKDAQEAEQRRLGDEATAARVAEQKRLDDQRAADELKRKNDELDAEKKRLESAGAEQARLLREQSDAFEREKRAETERQQAAQAELDSRREQLTADERAVQAALASVKDAESSRAAEGSEPPVDDVPPPTAEQVARDSAAVDATVRGREEAAAPQQSQDRGDATFGFRANKAYGQPAAAPAPQAPAPQVEAASAPAARPGEAIPRPDDATLLNALASLYNQRPAVVLTWLEEMDLYLLRGEVGQ